MIHKNYWNKSLIFEKIYRKILFRERISILNIILRNITISSNDSFLDVGTTPLLLKEENIIFRVFNKFKSFTSVSNQNCNILKKKYPKLKLVHSSIFDYNIKSKIYDIVYSSATIEHVGNLSSQKKFVKILYKLSKKFLIITTPNKYFPLDFHSKVLFLHYFPKLFRFFLEFCGEKFLSKEKNLNLLSKCDLINICRDLNIRNYKIYTNFLFFIPANYIIIVKKN